MVVVHTLTISSPVVNVTLTTPSGWVVLGTVGAVCATIVAISFVVESSRLRGRERKYY